MSSYFRLRHTKMTAAPFHPKKNEAMQEEFKENFKDIVELYKPDVRISRIRLSDWLHGGLTTGSVAQ